MIYPLRLANEWRDSIAITVGIAATAASLNAFWTLCLMIFFREHVRDVVWWTRPPKQIVGGPRAPDHKDVSDGSTLISEATMLLGYVVAPDSSSIPWLLYFWIFMLLLTVTRVHVFRRSSILRCIRAWLGAWDWPRKRDGGGATKKLADMIERATSRVAHAAGSARVAGTRP